jgi:ADP-ribosyl-[dinitrogen reductase] hydrolase
MTTPGTHNDTYAESYHRDVNYLLTFYFCFTINLLTFAMQFFSNYARGKSPIECAGAEGHDTASMGG